MSSTSCTGDAPVALFALGVERRHGRVHGVGFGGTVSRILAGVPRVLEVFAEHFEIPVDLVASGLRLLLLDPLSSFGQYEVQCSTPSYRAVRTALTVLYFVLYIQRRTRPVNRVRQVRRVVSSCSTKGDERSTKGEGESKAWKKAFQWLQTQSR